MYSQSVSKNHILTGEAYGLVTVLARPVFWGLDLRMLSRLG